VLELDGLVRSFGEVRALDGLTFAVPPGRMFGFLGPNGAGKTTAMRAIFGLTDLQAGEVRWEGRPVTRAVTRRFGYLPEERGLYPTMTVRDQLVYLGRIRGLSRSDAAAATDSWLARLGLSDRAGAKVQELSLGNQQRVQLAGSLLHRPSVVVLDEPFSGLDPVAVDVLSAELSKVADGGATVVFSSHQLDLVEGLCDDVAIIDRGRLVASGSVDELTRGESAHLVVKVGGAGGRWADEVPGAVVSEVSGDTVRLDLSGGGDAQAVLDAARRAGPVEHFGYERLRLSEVFRRSVGRRVEEVEAATGAAAS
jgi:ABC-2 type transport system ATP-binding protein